MPATPKPATPKPRRRLHQVDDDPFGAPTKADLADLKRQARGEEKRLEAIYEAGRKEGRTERPKGSAKPKSSTSRPKSKTASKKSPTRRAARQLAAPVRAQIRSGTRLITMTLGLLALYLFLSSAPQVSGALAGVTKGFTWLTRPDTTFLR